MKVFFDLAYMSTCCWGLPKPKYEPFITHNRGTLTWMTSVRIIYIYLYIIYLYLIYIIFSHLADAFIQTDLQMRTTEAIIVVLKQLVETC